MQRRWHLTRPWETSPKRTLANGPDGSTGDPQIGGQLADAGQFSCQARSVVMAMHGHLDGILQLFREIWKNTSSASVSPWFPPPLRVRFNPTSYF